MSTTQSQARMIAHSVIPSNDNGATDPTTVITAVVLIIGEVIKLYKSCNQTPDVAAQSMRDLSYGGLAGWLQRRKLWRIIQQQPLPPNISAENVYYATLRAGKFITVPEVAALYRGD